MKPFERILLLAVALGVLAFDVWTVCSSGDAWHFGQKQNDYYNLLIDGWRDGQLALKVDVPEAMLKLPDPYDPALRPPGLALHDASFYHGKYYLYFGVAPVVTLMLPFRLVTGIDLPQAVAEIVFVYGAFLASAAAWLQLRRRYFPESGAAVSAWCVLALGFASLGPVLLRRPHMWELPIGAGYCFAMLTLLAIGESLHATTSRRRALWFAGAGLFLGLAVGSRPTYLIASPLLLAPLAWWWREKKRAPWAELFAVTLPLALIGALLGLHNYLRFGDALQFGQAYQLSLDYESKMPHFRPGYALFNGWRYFFSAARWSDYFPFVSPADVGLKPAGFGGHDDVYGVLTNLPLGWFVLAAPLAFWRRSREVPGPLLAWLGAAAVLFVAMAGVLLCFFGSLARYELDFTPTLMLLACVGVLACERFAASQSAVVRRGTRLLWGGAVVVSVIFAALFSLQLNRLFLDRNPAGYRATARLLNHVPAAIQWLVGEQPGAWEIEFWLPRGERGQVQTLLSVGDQPEVDRVFIRVLDAANVQVGFARDAMPEISSRPLPLNFLQTHRLRVTLGAFLPPDTHPWFSGAAPAESRLASRIVRLELDDQVVLQTFRRFETTAGGRVRLGAKSLGSAAYPRFTGQLIAAHKSAVSLASLSVAAVAEKLPAEGGLFELKVKFPRERPAITEPLIVSGATGRGDMLGVEYLGGSAARFVFDHWGSTLLRSEAVNIDAGEHTIVVRLPWLDASSFGRIEQRGDLTIELDGQTIWRQSTMGYRADPEEISFCENPIGGSNVGAKFSGETLSTWRGRE